MRNNIKYIILFLILFETVFIQDVLFAQRAGTTVDRNEEAAAVNRLYEQGKWQQGKDMAEDKLKKSPRDSDMRMLVGKYYLHHQQYDKARYELVKSLEYAPANVDAKHMLVTVESETDRYSSAICYINELLEVNPYWKGLWRKKIELYRIMGNHVEADRLLKRISQIYPEDNELKNDVAYSMEQRAVAVKNTGKVNETIEIGKRIVDERPERPEAYITLIDNFIKAGDYNNALVYSERGLNQLPGNTVFVQKKIAVLEHQQRYSEILAFLEEQMKNGQNPSFRSQYNYFLLEAARNAKNSDPATLYGKIFQTSPGNKEAFDVVFNHLVAEQQYEEALVVLNRHRASTGSSKELDMKELTVYRRMDNKGKVAVLTHEYFEKYPNDVDLQDSYVQVALQRAKDNMEDGKIEEAITNWRDAVQYGDAEAVGIAQRGLYNAYVVGDRYQEAIMILDEMLLDEPENSNLLVKKADIYYKQGRYQYALTIYEQVITAADPQDRDRHIAGYQEFVMPVVKELKMQYKLEEARDYTKRWLAVEPFNQQALLYMIDLCNQLQDHEGMLAFAKIAEERHFDDMGFKIKLAQAINYTPEKLSESWELLHAQLKFNPYHQPLANTFSATTEEYATVLLKEKNHQDALGIINTALIFDRKNKGLKYMKGIAYEGLKQYDSAYHYQQYYEPSLLEYEEFRQHLYYLNQRSFANNIGIYHLRARFGDDYSITSISTVEYSRLLKDGAYVGRINYAGREEGKGIQGQVEWEKLWTDRLTSRADMAISNKYFAQFMLNGALMYQWKPAWEIEGGLGYRRFFTKQNLFNLNLGAGKEIDDFKLSARWSNFLFDENTYLYSLSAKAQYFMSTPKNYIMAVGSIGNSPDIDLLNYRLYDSFNVFNAMVGAGVGRSFTKNVHAGVLGTWYNFQTDARDKTYKNLYNLYLQLNVAF